MSEHEATEYDICHDHLLRNVGLALEAVLVETERGREDKGRVVLLEEEVDDVEETTQVAVLVVVPNGNERRGNVGGNADSVLDIQRLMA